MIHMIYDIIENCLKKLLIDYPIRYQQLGEQEVQVIGIFLNDIAVHKRVNGDVEYIETLLTVQFHEKDDIHKGYRICELINKLNNTIYVYNNTHTILGFNSQEGSVYKGLTDKGLHLFSQDFIIQYRIKRKEDETYGQ